MKYLGMLLITLVLGIFYNPSESLAQEVISQSEPSKKEVKLARQLEKAKINLAQAQANLLKYKANYNKKRTKFQKDNSKGKLSPNAIAKQTKSLDSLNKKVDKEIETIEKLEKFILLNDPESPGIKNLP